MSAALRVIAMAAISLVGMVALSGEASRRYTVLVLPAGHLSADPAAKAPVEAFHADMLRELRNVPAINLIVAEDAESVGRVSADYRLTVASLATSTDQRGNVRYRSIDGKQRGFFPAGSPLIGTQWPLQIQVEQDGRILTRGPYEVVLLAKPGVPLPRLCDNEIRPQTGMGALCLTSSQLAIQQVEALRLQTFPPDPAMHQLLVARIGDASLAERQRSIALGQLMTAHRQDRSPGLDSAAAAAIVKFAAAYPQQHGAIWRSVRGNPHAELLGPLLDSLRADAERSSRLDALTTLVADYGDQQRARQAFEVAGRSDADELVRMVARRAVSGEGEWRNYVLATLRQADLPPAKRVEPLLYVTESERTLSDTGKIKALANDAEIVAALLALGRDGRNESPSQRGSIRRALNMLSTMDNPALLATHSQSIQELRMDYGSVRRIPTANGEPAALD